MPRGYPQLTNEQKQEIINRIKEKGEKVSDLSKEYGVVPKTIYNLLRKTAQGAGALLELAKLKRENEALLKIIGHLTVQERLGKKIRYGRGD
jgi:transposase-like protein